MNINFFNNNNNNNKNDNKNSNNIIKNNNYNHDNFLFFQIWKNKKLLNLIFSKIHLINRYKKSYSYYDCTNLSWLLKNNHYSLIKDKLKRIKSQQVSNYNNSIQFYQDNLVYFQIDNKSLEFIGKINDIELFQNLLDYYFKNFKIPSSEEILEFINTISINNDNNYNKLKYFLINHLNKIKNIINWGNESISISYEYFNFLYYEKFEKFEIVLKKLENQMEKFNNYKYFQLYIEILKNENLIQSLSIQLIKLFYKQIELNHDIPFQVVQLLMLEIESPNNYYEISSYHLIKLLHLIYQPTPIDSLDIIKLFIDNLGENVELFRTISIDFIHYSIKVFFSIGKSIATTTSTTTSTIFKDCNEILWYFFNNSNRIFILPVEFSSIVAYFGDLKLMESLLSIAQLNNFEPCDYLSPNSINLACLSGTPFYNDNFSDINVDYLILSKYFGYLMKLIEEINNIVPYGSIEPQILFINEDNQQNKYISNLNNFSNEFKETLNYFISQKDQLLYQKYTSISTTTTATSPINNMNKQYLEIMKLLIPYIYIDDRNESLAISIGIGNNQLILDYYLNYTLECPNIDWLVSTLCFLNKQELFLNVFSKNLENISNDAFSLCLNYSIYNCNKEILKYLYNNDNPKLKSLLEESPIFPHLIILPILKGSLEMVKLLHLEYNQEILESYLLISILINKKPSTSINLTKKNNNEIINEIKNNISKLEFSNRNKISKYLIENFIKSNYIGESSNNFSIRLLEISCFMENQEIIEFILDYNQNSNQNNGYDDIYNFYHYINPHNDDIKIILSNGMDFKIIEKILNIKLKLFGQYQLFESHIFSIAFVNGFIEIGELFLKSNYIDWSINQIDSNTLIEILKYCKSQLVLEFLFVNQSSITNYISLDNLNQFYNSITSYQYLQDLSIILSNHSVLSILSIFNKNNNNNNNNNSIIFNNDNNINIIKYLISNNDLNTLKKLNLIIDQNLFYKFFNWNLFSWSIKFENLNIISYLFLNFLKNQQQKEDQVQQENFKNKYKRKNSNNNNNNNSYNEKFQDLINSTNNNNLQQLLKSFKNHLNENQSKKKKSKK